MKSGAQLIRWAAAAAALTMALGFIACAAGRPPGPTVVAVWDLEELGPLEVPSPHLGNLLAGQIMARLDASQGYRVVERESLLKVLEELQLGSSELADSRTRLRLGNLLGAGHMIFGAFQGIGRVQRVDLRLVDVASGKILRTGSGTAVSSDLNGWLQAADQAAAELIK
jgi:hypothetical protein